METITHYMEMEAYEEALAAVDKLMLEEHARYYPCLLLKLSCLVALRQYQEANRIIVEELKMPYIPIDIQKTLIMKQEEIESVLKYQERMHPLYFDETEIEYIFEQQQLEAMIRLCEYFDVSNVRQHVHSIKRFLSKEGADPFIQSFLIEILLKQGIEDTICVSKNGYIIEVELERLNPLSNQAIYIQTEATLKTMIDDNPTFLELCLSYMTLYFTQRYPVLEDVEDVALVAAAIQFIVADLQKLEINKSNALKLNQLSLNQVLQKIEEMKFE